MISHSFQILVIFRSLNILNKSTQTFLTNIKLTLTLSILWECLICITERKYFIVFFFLYLCFFLLSFFFLLFLNYKIIIWNVNYLHTAKFYGYIVPTALEGSKGGLYPHPSVIDLGVVSSIIISVLTIPKYVFYHWSVYLPRWDISPRSLNENGVQVWFLSNTNTNTVPSITTRWLQSYQHQHIPVFHFPLLVFSSPPLLPFFSLLVFSLPLSVFLLSILFLLLSATWPPGRLKTVVWVYLVCCSWLRSNHFKKKNLYLLYLQNNPKIWQLFSLYKTADSYPCQIEGLLKEQALQWQ